MTHKDPFLGLGHLEPGAAIAPGQLSPGGIRQARAYVVNLKDASWLSDPIPVPDKATLLSVALVGQSLNVGNATLRATWALGAILDVQDSRDLTHFRPFATALNLTSATPYVLDRRVTGIGLIRLETSVGDVNADGDARVIVLFSEVPLAVSA